MRPPTALLTLFLIAAPPLAAQKIAPLPTRPRIQELADTNDARAYYRYGLAMLSDKPAESVRGFYWALQIDPSSAETMYALRTSSLLAMSAGDLYDYFDWHQKKRKPEYLAIDSLLYRAYTVNPFVYRNMDVPLIRAIIEADVIKYDPSVDRAELGHLVLEHLSTMRKEGWLSYAEGRLPDALEGYSKQLHDKGRNTKDHEDNDGEIHADRARVFYQAGNMDSARAELTAENARIRERGQTAVDVLYEMEQTYEERVGITEEEANTPSDGRGAARAQWRTGATDEAGRAAGGRGEPREGAEGNASQHSRRRAQYRVRMSQALERIRKVRRHAPKVGAVCGKAARTDLCGGRSAMSVPTAIAADLERADVQTRRPSA
mgnify:CR=1 FL=1